MHLHARALRNVIGALALVAFALPAAALTATPAGAQGAPPPASVGGGTASPAIAFNAIGYPHTVTFTCASTAAGAGAAGGALPGCYQVTGTVTDATTGTASTFVSGQCGNSAADTSTATLNCSTYTSPLINCPAGATTSGNNCVVVFGTVVGGVPVSAANCGPVFGGTTTPAGAVTACSIPNKASVTINPGTPHVYTIQYTFYTLVSGTAGAAGCPGGTFIPGPATIQRSTGAPPLTAAVVVPEGVCRYTVAAQKKYVEVTSVTLTPVSGCANTTVFYSEGLKAYFSPACVVSATASGTVILKTGVNCATELAALPSSAPAEYGAGATYSCVGDTLSVINVPSSVFAPAGGLPITLSPSGLAPRSSVVTFGGLCAGGAGAAPVLFTDFPGAASSPTVTLCATGVGPASIFGTYLGPINTQPSVVSNTITFTLSLPNAARVVPTVRWAGEKAVLTKCFGGAGTFGGASVEFTLQGSSIANASLIPTTDPTAAGSNVNFASTDTVWTTADADGCASVIVYARSEGIVNVDASIFGTVAGAGGAPLLNEHAFTVYYLKFERVDLENVVFKAYTADTISPSLAFNTTPPVGPTPPGAKFPGGPSPIGIAAAFPSYSLPNPPGTGFVAGAAPVSVPLCTTDYVRAMVHGYFEIPGDPSGRPAANVTINGAPTGAPTGGFGSVGSYVLPAGRWVLPDDWPVLATFAGFNGTSPVQNSTPGVSDPSSVFAWDLNSGFVFNPGGERADLGYGPSTAPAKATTGPIALVAGGPFFGQDAAKQPYSTAGPPDAGYPAACAAGLTIGIGPFDATQACTNPFPLAFSPAGSTRLTSGPVLLGSPPGTINFVLTPTGPNSTYLPNATLNQWDAPMPPAQVSFGITSGPGYLQEANKQGIYNIPFLSKAAPDASGVCPAGTTGNGAPATACIVRLYPDPFYGEAIPASPLIPPIINNGGYLWNTWGFTSGTTVGLTTAAGFVAGESTGATSFGAAACPFGFTAGAGGCSTAAGAVTAPQCIVLGGTYNAVTTTCQIGFESITAPPVSAGTIAGGTNLTPVGNTCPPGFTPAGITAPDSQVQVANGAGFQVGQTVEAYSTANGQTLAAGLRIASIAAGAGGTAYLTFTTPINGCIPAATAVFISEQIGIALPGGVGSLPAGTSIGLFINGRSASTSVATGASGGVLAMYTYPVNGATYQFFNSAEAVIRALGNCVLSRGPVGGPAVFGTCEPGAPPLSGTTMVVPAGTLITTAATTMGGGAPITGHPDSAGGNTGPYPFWQWVPNPAPSPAAGNRTAGTVYSDNHGEAMVALQTGVTTTTAPTAGVCPTGYSPDAVPATICFLKYETLGGTNPAGSPFQNIAQALAAFPAGTSGCLDTTAAGTASPSTNNALGANGPADGQICINTLGRIEFGKLASLGTTTVQAVADYPYTRGDHPAISSAVLTKVWTSQFAKTVTLSPAIAGPAGTQSYVVTISATDICGAPIVGEPVLVYAVGNAGAVVLAPTSAGAALGTTNATVVTDDNGLATLSLEVLTAALGTNGLVIKAVFPGEGIERFATVVAPTPTSSTVQVIYTPGYNMVGGPAGSNFGSAEAVFSYDNATNAYVNQTASESSLSSAAPACTGYFAYFASATTVNLPATSKAGDTATCTLAAGWNLIGNPFASAAVLPSGTTAYHYNGSTYDVVGSIPVGGAVYIYNSGAATTITLTAQ